MILLKPLNSNVNDRQIFRKVNMRASTEALAQSCLEYSLIDVLEIFYHSSARYRLRTFQSVLAQKTSCPEKRFAAQWRKCKQNELFKVMNHRKKTCTGRDLHWKKTRKIYIEKDLYSGGPVQRKTGIETNLYKEGPVQKMTCVERELHREGPTKRRTSVDRREHV